MKEDQSLQDNWVLLRVFKRGPSNALHVLPRVVSVNSLCADRLLVTHGKKLHTVDPVCVCVNSFAVKKSRRKNLLLLFIQKNDSI